MPDRRRPHSTRVDRHEMRERHRQVRSGHGRQEDGGEFAVGVHNATDFLHPATAVRASVAAEPLHQGRTQQLWQVIIADSDSGKALARGQVPLQNVPLPA